MQNASHRLFAMACMFSTCLSGQAYKDDPRLAYTPKPIIRALKKHPNLQIYNAGTPFYIVADFDGDDKPDYAIRVFSTNGSKGLLFVLSSKRAEHVLGFGSYTELAPDWSFSDWHLCRHWQQIQLGQNSIAPQPKGDYLTLTWGDTGSFHLCFQNSKFIRYGGD